ncbi:hypothetical protein CRENBAI_004857, partial [Crenichthys baileyi]
HQGAGPDPRVNSADEVKQKAPRGSPALRGAAGRNAADSTDEQGGRQNGGERLRGTEEWIPVEGKIKFSFARKEEKERELMQEVPGNAHLWVNPPHLIVLLFVCDIDSSGGD